MRRLSSLAVSLQRAQSQSASAQHHQHQTHPHAHPHYLEPASPTTRRPPPAAASAQHRLGLVPQPLSESPDEHREYHEPSKPVPANQVDSEDTDAAFLARLERMEEAQRRMEDLLVRLASKLS